MKASLNRYWQMPAIVTGVMTQLCMAGAHAAEEYDPWEKTNRKIFAFNEFMDRNLLVPVAKTYDAVTPDAVDAGITNVFQNAMEPLTTVNGVAQFKFSQALSDTARFIVNSTVGFFGVFDVATHIGLEKHHEDFGQTLGYWGVGTGPYLMVPFFGPRTVRHAVGQGGDYFTHLSYTYFGDNLGEDAAMFGLKAVDFRSDLMASEEFITGDRYLFIRSAYLQRREYLTNDGKVENEFEDEFGIFEDE
ncbi:VacJ family lipoprotein [Thalassolituus sp.]|uniref:MlaA family lipoprotein n=1 Tax=Thalassolituus sp. TaxID=2030822 RepID=UPI0026299C22|nr:VacJ family lipoprotein [uncultured Thalassolituus sp.]